MRLGKFDRRILRAAPLIFFIVFTAAGILEACRVDTGQALKAMTYLSLAVFWLDRWEQ